MLTLLTLSLLSITDIRFRRIPKATTLLLLVIHSIAHPSRLPIAILIFLVFCLLRWISNFSVGYGDVRLSPIAALITDSLTSCIELFLSCWCFAGLWLLALRRYLLGRYREETLPFAPFFTLSAIFQAS